MESPVSSSRSTILENGHPISTASNKCSMSSERTQSTATCSTQISAPLDLTSESAETTVSAMLKSPPERMHSNLSFTEVYNPMLSEREHYPMEQEGTFFSIDDTDECHCSEGIFQSSPLATPPDSMKYSFRPKPALVGAALTPTLSSLNELVESNQGQLQPYIMPGVLATPTSHNASLGSTTPIGGSVAESSYESASARRGGPVLYSAIGSLEDPATSSFPRNARDSGRIKFEFPSSGLLPPPNQMRLNKPSTQSLMVLPIFSVRGPSPKQSTLSRKLVEAEQAAAVLSSSSSSSPRPSSPSPHPTKYTRDELTQSPRPLQPAPQPPPSQIDGHESIDTVKPSIENGSSQTKMRSSFKPKRSQSNGDAKKAVTIAAEDKTSSKSALSSSGGRGKKKKKKPKDPVEMFRPSSDAYTPRMGKKGLKYKPAEMRTPVQKMASPLGTLSRPDFRDALRRVAMIIHKHIVKIESRFENKNATKKDDGLFAEAMKEEFSEEGFVTPKYRCTMVRVPMARPGMVFGLIKVRQRYDIPTEAEIYEFAHQLFQSVQLSSECSIVCLIYVERLMEQAKVPLLACTWRPIFMCGLLLASKVWQDLSTWNIEFAGVYPQYSLESINRLELQFLRRVKWDLYISSSLYAKYYFALRSLVEKQDFRNRYNRMVAGVNDVRASDARKIEQRSTQVKEEALLQLSRSM